MPSERRIVAYRPDETEERLLIALTKKKGLSMSRIIGQAIREYAKQEGIAAEEQEGGAK